MSQTKDPIIAIKENIYELVDLLQSLAKNLQEIRQLSAGG